MSLIERKESFKEILISSLWVLVAGLIWSIIILIFSFIIWSQSNVFDNIANSKFWAKWETLYSIIFAVLALFWTTITSLFSYKFLWALNPEKYKTNFVIFSQVAFFQILIFIFISPIYLYFGWSNFENNIIIFIFHIFVVTFWTNIILEVLNNYRYVIIWIYWSFIWLFISLLVVISVFKNFSSWNAKLFSLLFLLPIISFSIIFIKKLFEFVYFHFYRITWSDPIWDIFYKIKKEDEENEKEEEQKNLL